MKMNPFRWLVRRRKRPTDQGRLQFAINAVRVAEQGRHAAEIGALRAEVARVNDALNEARANIDEMQQEHEAQIERLTDPKLANIHIESGAILEMGIQPSVVTKVLAACFAQLLGDAPNWSSFEVGPFETWQGTLLVTVRRCSGESPEFQVGELKAKLAGAENDAEEANGLIGKIDTQISDALETIGRSPPKPAGFPDRVDAICDEAISIWQSYEDTEDDAERFQKELDEAQDRIVALDVELTLAVETVRKLRKACYLSRLAFRESRAHLDGYQPEIDRNTSAILAADRFLAPHTTPEIATR